jgi:photosystem II stability/assembly factor-like uncharacterized protein
MKSTFFLVLFTLCMSTSFSQSPLFTPYDNLPGLIKSVKPAYREDLPDWAKLMYQYPANANDINRLYTLFQKKHPEKKDAYSRYYKMWYRAVAPFADELGNIHIPDLSHWYEQQRKMQLASAGSPAKKSSQGNWSFVGPTETVWLNSEGAQVAPKSCPWQVNIYAFDIAKSNDNVLYAGSETGYMSKSVDKGDNWTLLAQGYFFGGGITAIAVHPENADIVYAAAGNQVHITTDGGNTWLPLLGPERFYADRLHINPELPSQLLACTPDGLFLSEDGGKSWQKKWQQPVYDAAFRPDDPDVIYALTLVADRYALLLSTDKGKSFMQSPHFPATYTPSSGGLLAVTAAKSDMLLVLMLAKDNTPVLLKGTFQSNVSTWKLQATGQTAAFPMDNGQGYYDLVLAVSPLNENVIMAGTTTLFKSTNGGATFTAVGGYAGNFPIHPDLQDIEMLPTGETWVATDGGMSLSTDNFTNQSGFFVKVNGLAGSDFWGFDQGWNEDIVVGGRYHNGNTAIADFYNNKALRMGGAESPTGWILKGKSRHAAFDDLGNGWILPARAEGKPEGRFLFTKFPNMDEYGGRRGNLVHHPMYYGTLFLGEGNGFWQSEDAGANWTLLYNFPDRVRYLQISYSNPDVLYADVVGKGLYRSADGGKNWQLKPALTAAPYGNGSWRGKLFFEISPSNPNTLYACLQNGTWSADIGKVFYSTDGGDTWKDITGSISEYMKCLVVQPDEQGNDLVYLFTTAKGSKPAKVYIRNQTMTDWQPFDNQYPAGMAVNHALPFFRDGKIRVAGNNGVWESPLLINEFKAIPTPWVEKKSIACKSDTIQLEDHSILMHDDASWKWEIQPTPAWHNGLNQRNPKIIAGVEASFHVSLTITQKGKTYSRSIPDFFTVNRCPSVEDCSNPDWIDKKKWTLINASSQEVNDPGLARMSFDGDESTIWHTRWTTGDDPYPHEISFSLGAPYRIYQFDYLARQDGTNGRIKQYAIYISKDSLNWGSPVATGNFINTAASQSVQFPTGVEGKYVRIKALSEVNGNPWASAAEFSLKGCYASAPSSAENTSLLQMTAYPIPCSDQLSVLLPLKGPVNYTIVSQSGAVVSTGVHVDEDKFEIDTSDLPSGVYVVQCVSASKQACFVRFVKGQ